MNVPIRETLPDLSGYYNSAGFNEPDTAAVETEAVQVESVHPLKQACSAHTSPHSSSRPS